MLFCSCATSQRHREEDEIKRIFQADRAAYVQAFHAKDLAKTQRSAPTLITQYTIALREIDMTKAPTDFRVAYLEHIQAWEGLAAEMNRKPEPADIGALFGLLGAVASHAHPLAALGGFVASQTNKPPRTTPTRNELKETAQRRIRETWNKVELVAVQRGVDLK